MSQLRAIRTLALILVLAVFSAGCAKKTFTNDFPEDVKLRYDGGPLPAETWADADGYEADAPPTRSWNMTWLLPLSLYGKTAEFESSHKLATHKTTYNDLGFPLLFLPLRYHSKDNLHSREGYDAVHKARVEWNLLYAKSRVSDKWPDNRPSLYARGFPLVFSKGTWRDLGKSSGRRTDVSGWNTLWSIGPAYLTFKSREADRSEPRNEQRATVGMPLAIGGFPGTLVWLDADVTDHKEYTRERFTTHGPLFGMLGFFRSSRQARWNSVPNLAGEDDPRRLGFSEYYKGLIAGVLWYDQGSQYDALPETENTGHGPLWGMFGWGKKNGLPAVRIFWLPIRV